MKLIFPLEFKIPDGTISYRQECSLAIADVFIEAIRYTGHIIRMNSEGTGLPTKIHYKDGKYSYDSDR